MLGNGVMIMVEDTAGNVAVRLHLVWMYHICGCGQRADLLGASCQRPCYCLCLQLRLQVSLRYWINSWFFGI